MSKNDYIIKNNMNGMSNALCVKYLRQRIYLISHREISENFYKYMNYLLVSVLDPFFTNKKSLK